jgi:hypothetical protein
VWLPTASDPLIGVDAPTVEHDSVPDNVTPPGALFVCVNVDDDDPKLFEPDTLTATDPGETTKPSVTPV